MEVLPLCIFFFFFQAEDGIRDGTVTGVQTCALPISKSGNRAIEQSELRLFNFGNYGDFGNSAMPLVYCGGRVLSSTLSAPLRTPCAVLWTTFLVPCLILWPVFLAAFLVSWAASFMSCFAS